MNKQLNYKKQHLFFTMLLFVCLGINLHGQTGSAATPILRAASANEFNYPDIPDDTSSEPETVGSTAGAFSVSATGGAVYSIPIDVPQGVGGMQPSIAIVYNSQSGNGMVGWGCNLSGLSTISRAPKDIYHDGTAKALTYLADDAYYLDGQRLIYSSGATGQEGAVYYPESDPFTKVTVHGTYNASTANTWFEVQSSNGLKYYYGSTASGQQSYTAGSSPRILAWYLDHVEDPLGNFMDYTYSNLDYYPYPSTITYGSNKNESTGYQHTVTFSYENRNDVVPFVVEGINGSMSYRLRSITSKTGRTNIYRTYELQYDTASDGSGVKYSRLTTITEKNGAGEAMKPTQLTWSFLPSFSQSVTQPAINVDALPLFPATATSDPQYFAADLNGDGLTDLVWVAPVKISNNNGYTLDTYAYIYWASLDASGNVKYTYSSNYSLGASFQIGNWSEKKGCPFVLDFNGDGINELVVPNASIIPDINYKNAEFKFVSGALKDTILLVKLQYSSELPLYAAADMNNDGKGDIIFMEKGANAGKHACGIRGFNSGTTLYSASFDLSLPYISVLGLNVYANPEKMFLSDFNGDGLCDMLIFHSLGYTIFWNQGSGISNSTFSDSKKTSGTTIADVRKIWSGDFNGDGLMDFLMNASNDNKWYFAFNSGNGTFTKQLACTLEIYDQSLSKDDDKFDCFIFDFDNDGKSDVVITKAMYNSSLGIFNKTYTYWMRSTGNALVQAASATSTREADARSACYVLGDFIGDGQIQLMNYGYNCYNSTNANSDPVWRLYRNSSFTADKGKVTSIYNAMGRNISISYASLVNGGIYVKGTGSSYPMADYTLPIHVVKTVTENNGAADNLTTNYQYSGLKAHLQGRGLLGMTSVKANNLSLGVTTESGVKSWNTSFYIPSENYAKTTIGGKTAETNITMSITDKSSKKYFAYPSTQTDKDLDGNTTTTTRKFDASYGYPTEEKADFGNNMYKTIQYTDYILAGQAYQPQTITRIQKHTDDANSFTQKTKIIYDASKGWRKQVIENYGSSLPLTTDYTYDTFGNIKTSKTSGSGISPVTKNYDYDVTKRFVAKIYTSPASLVNTFTYDTWGNVLTEKDETKLSSILTTTHAYDNWGNRKSTILPDGTKTTFQKGWNNSGAKRYFTLVQGTGQPWVKTWYDNRGREVLMETIGAKSMKIQNTTYYTGKGQIQKKEMKTGDITTFEQYTYDGRGRVTSSTHSAGQNISYSYGNRLVTTVTNGQTDTKTYDAWKNIKSATDPLTSVSYTYFSLGKPKKALADGIEFSMEYFDTGTQKKLIDPSAGTTSYEYDAAGRLTKQTDGRGKVTLNVYNALGRLDTTKIDGIPTIYTYGASSDWYQLTRQQTGNNSIAYIYDNLGRIQKETRQIDGNGSLDFNFAYNTQGQLSSITYPGDVEAIRQYDTYGNLQNLLVNSFTYWELPVWELTGANGMVTTEQLGGTLTFTETRNSQGLLTNFTAEKKPTSPLSFGLLFYDIDYTFDGATGNLTSRRNLVVICDFAVKHFADIVKEIDNNILLLCIAISLY